VICGAGCGSGPLGGAPTVASPGVSRILSRTTICLGQALLPGSCGLPGTWRAGHPVPARPCSRWGLPSRPVTRDAGGLLHHRFTLACGPEDPSAVCSLLHFPSGRPAWVLPSTVPCGVRTFLDAGASRSSPGLATPNGSGCVERWVCHSGMNVRHDLPLSLRLLCPGETVGRGIFRWCNTAPRRR